VGLAIARKVIEGHGGRLSAEAREGGGARFCIELPAGR
jgi:signal transduction histidine kinase